MAWWGTPFIARLSLQGTDTDHPIRRHARGEMAFAGALESLLFWALSKEKRLCVAPDTGKNVECFCKKVDRFGKKVDYSRKKKKRIVSEANGLFPQKSGLVPRKKWTIFAKKWTVSVKKRGGEENQRWPTSERKCYVTPTFSGVPEKGFKSGPRRAPRKNPMVGVLKGGP